MPLSALRVAAYCRVSTDKDDQAHSLCSQKQFFTDYIRRRDGWEFMGIYADEGISGTSTRKRTEFRRMIADAKAHRLDLILTKEISRFARNTLDSIYYTRQLKACGVGVVFLNDGIRTADADSELRLTIMASIAQEESRKISERVKWGQRRRMEQGVVFGRSLLGYDVRDGRMTVNEAEAGIVRMVYSKFLDEGKGAHTIARELTEAGVPTKRGAGRWSPTVIARMLRNEKYAGDLLQQKTYTPDFLDHRRLVNRGGEETICLRNHHEPIIGRERWDAVQEELRRRSPDALKREKYSSRYWCSGRIFCGACGSRYVSRVRRRVDGSLYRAWRCGERVRGGGCANGCLNHIILGRVAGWLLETAVGSRQSVSEKAMTLLRRLPSQGPAQPGGLRRQIEALQAKKERLIDLALDGAISRDDLALMNRRYTVKIGRLRQEAGEAELAARRQAALPPAESGPPGYWDETVLREAVEKIVVFPKEGRGRAVDLYLAGCPAPFHIRFEASGRENSPLSCEFIP